MKQNPVQTTVQQTLQLPHDIHGAIAPAEPVQWLPWLAVAALTVLSVVLFLLWRNRKRTPEQTLEDQFLDRLDRLHPLQKSAACRWVDSADNLLRSYLEARFSLPGTRQTTSEFIHSAAFSRLPALREFQTELQRCRQQADLIKFARHHPDSTEIQRLERTIRSFIERSRTDRHGGRPC